MPLHRVDWLGFAIPPIGTLNSARMYAYAGLRRLPEGFTPHWRPTPGRQLDNGARGSSPAWTAAPPGAGAAATAHAGGGGIPKTRKQLPTSMNEQGVWWCPRGRRMSVVRCLWPVGLVQWVAPRKQRRYGSAVMRPKRRQAANQDGQTFVLESPSGQRLEFGTPTCVFQCVI